MWERNGGGTLHNVIQGVKRERGSGNDEHGILVLWHEGEVGVPDHPTYFQSEIATVIT